MNFSCAISVIIPAHDEADHIDDCLRSLWASDPVDGGAEVVVVANGCSDNTVARARAHTSAATRVGWNLQVLDLPVGNKAAALTAGDVVATGQTRVYVDADVTVSSALIAQLQRSLDGPAPGYASGQAVIAPPRTHVTRHYIRFWKRLPFVAKGVPGFGVYAVNAAGRKRWQDFPDIISDDTFVRLSFAPEERRIVPATFVWPAIEGFAPLVRVRRRQDAGVTEIAQRFPEHMTRDDKRRPGLGELVRFGLSDPVGFAVYSTVMLSAKFTRRLNKGWARGR
ncbi:glycosyltransferase [uncultured Jannaschia sp.]|uniref:glycosyltransferase family 2 protein n=1 Tax=uncultured Jannaschia sp. TaxID=293347 RepID=UPI002609E5DE|nr:glycosyltransferase [uncultured Jannaschia sp.]